MSQLEVVNLYYPPQTSYQDNFKINKSQLSQFLFGETIIGRLLLSTYFQVCGVLSAEATTLRGTGNLECHENVSLTMFGGVSVLVQQLKITPLLQNRRQNTNFLKRK